MTLISFLLGSPMEMLNDFVTLYHCPHFVRVSVTLRHSFTHWYMISLLTKMEVFWLFISKCLFILFEIIRERSGSVVECLTRDRRAAGSSLTGVTALCP